MLMLYKGAADTPTRRVRRPTKDVMPAPRRRRPVSKPLSFIGGIGGRAGKNYSLTVNLISVIQSSLITKSICQAPEPLYT